MDCYVLVFAQLFLISYVVGSPQQTNKFADLEQFPLTSLNFASPPNNPDYTYCSNDPEEDMTPVEIIRRNGYTGEEHFVTTEDGYILSVYRIPGPEGSRTIFMQHGLYDSAMCWIVNGKNKSLAYLLANKGYDIWLGNARGNTYSKNHTKLSPSDSEFWNFSWQEMGGYDLPAVIEYITALKNETLTYIAHSMGNTMYFVMANERPDVAAKIRLMIGMAPAARISNVKGLLQMTLGPFQIYEKTHNGHSEIYPQNALFNWVGKCVCSRPLIRGLCRDFISGIAGFNPKNFDLSLLPLIITHFPAGTSMKTIYHFIQLVKEKKFRKYNYGPQINLRIYNDTEPPAYELTKVETPIALFYGTKDNLIPYKDVEKMFKEFPNRIGLYKMENFNHLDFVIGYRAPNIVNPRVFSILEKY